MTIRAYAVFRFLVCRAGVAHRAGTMGWRCSGVATGARPKEQRTPFSIQTIDGGEHDAPQLWGL